MNVLQPTAELERWYEKPDPWQYESNPDDLNRRAMLLSVLPKRQYQNVLDIGCGLKQKISLSLNSSSASSVPRVCESLEKEECT